MSNPSNRETERFAMRRKEESVMTDWKFKVGQKVRLIPQAWDLTAPPGDFLIVSLLPKEGNDNQYRIQSVSDGHHRVVREGRLA